MRVQTVVNELKGEKIDIVKWNADPAKYIANALSPAKVVAVDVNETEKASRVIVPDYQLSLAIGKSKRNWIPGVRGRTSTRTSTRWEWQRVPKRDSWRLGAQTVLSVLDGSLTHPIDAHRFMNYDLWAMSWDPAADGSGSDATRGARSSSFVTHNL
jgi:hypothetical protein